MGIGASFRSAEVQDGNLTAAHPYVAPGLIPSGLEQEIKRVEAEVDQIEQQSIAEWRALAITSSTRTSRWGR